MQTPSAEGLGAEGAIPNPTLLRRGEFTWRAPIEGGGWVPRTTGEGIAGWTPLDAAGLAKAANCGRLSHQAYETRTLACDTTFADQGYETAQACKDAIPHYWSEAAGCVMFPGALLPASWPPRRLSLLNS